MGSMDLGMDSVVVAHRLSCSMTCGAFPDKGSNPCLQFTRVSFTMKALAAAALGLHWGNTMVVI